jgi:hypothetical protein
MEGWPGLLPSAPAVSGCKKHLQGLGWASVVECLPSMNQTKAKGPSVSKSSGPVLNPVSEAHDPQDCLPLSIPACTRGKTCGSILLG